MGRSSRSDFSFSITKIAVAQICQSVGYDAAQTFALDILSNVTNLYLKAIAKSAADSANSCGRTHSNLFDIVIALEDLSSGQGFPGSSSSALQNPITSSSLLKEIKKFVLYTDEIPFAQPLPRENLRKLGRYSDDKRSHCLGHVPRWLPEMPMIERKEEELEKGEEILRWNSDSGAHQNLVVVGEGKVKDERRGEGKELELPEKRGKVRFEIGLKGKSRGVLSRFGNGKRVLCHNFSSNGNGIEGNDRKKKKMVMIPSP